MSNRHWKSLRDLHEGPQARPEQLREFANDNPAQLSSGLDRRSFLGLMGASAALAGTTTLGGCLRKDAEYILPYSDRPEDLIPGAPRYYRTAMATGDSVVGLHVASVDGRPTKVEGSPDHPLSQGGTNRWNQAATIGLYDPDRSKKVVHKGADSTSTALYDALATVMAQHVSGAALGLLVDGTPSPTLWRLLAEFSAKNPKATIYRHDLAFDRSQAEGLAAVGLSGVGVYHDLSQADIVVALDADIFAAEGDTVSIGKGFAKKRRVTGPKQPMNRLYVVEPRFTVTGAMADNRLRVPGSHVGEFLRGIAGAAVGASAAAEIRGAIVDRQGTEPGGLAWNKEKFIPFVNAVGTDLAANKGKSVVIVGERQPAWVHGLAAYLNDALGNTGKTVFYTPINRPNFAPIEALSADLDKGNLRTLITLGGSPAYDAPGDLGLADKLKKLETLIHFGLYVDETADLATWHAPLAHSLEAWGDLVASEGTIAVQQPLIAPLYEAAVSPIEVMARLLGDTAPNAYTIVRATHVSDTSPLGENTWRRAVHGGIIRLGEKAGTATLDLAGLKLLLATDKGPTRPTLGALEVNFIRDPSVLDGRFSNVTWLQELPDPMSKLTWDNAAYLSPATAKELGLETSGTPESATEVKGDMIEVSLGGRSIKIVAWVLPGVADNVLILPIGYGRELGFVSTGSGFNVNPIRTVAAPFIAYGATVKPLNERYVVATTQEYGTMVEPRTGVKRPIVRENTLKGYAEEPEFVEKDEVMEAAELTSLWTPPNETTGQQWGLTIDLNTCTGCNVCTIACQAENNIPVVGKERVTNGREMHWIRLDRYFTGDENEPQAVVQPIACAQCEMAPCENVCPVAATTHSPEGLNDMAYNRCIGTRYCTNNCPFKVRRFNFFNYNKERQERAPLEGMQHNPNVTVRFRGIVEKCTYCVQRINEAKIAVKRAGKSTVDDGGIVPACAQACPTDAIIFGDINDPNSRVTQSKKEPRNYELLRELNLHARTSFLAKLRNPNPALV